MSCSPAPPPIRRRLKWLLSALAGVVLLLLGTSAVVVERQDDAPRSVWLPEDFKSGDHPFVDPTGKRVAGHLRVKVAGPNDIIELEPATDFDRWFGSAQEWVRTHLGPPASPRRYHWWVRRPGFTKRPCGPLEEWVRLDVWMGSVVDRLSRARVPQQALGLSMLRIERRTVDDELPRLRTTIDRLESEAASLDADDPALPGRLRHIEDMKSIEADRLREKAERDASAAK